MSILYTIVILATLAAIPTRSDTPLGCDEGWVQRGNYCYAFYNTRMVTWKQASDECDRFDSSVLYFDDLDEEAWYVSYVANYSAVAATAYWTALNDIPPNQPMSSGDGKWKWGSYSYADVSLIVWNTSPANDGLANCGGLNAQGKMSDIDCNSKQGYICQYQTTADQPGCSLGWFSGNQSCYFISNSTDPSQLVTWKDAQTACIGMTDYFSKQSLGARLLSIDDVNDKTFVMTKFQYFTQNANLHWTALQYAGTNQWKWANGGAVTNGLFQWANEPDNVAGTESCAVIRANGRFSDRDCNSPQYYICKKTQDYSSSSYNLGCDTWIRAGKNCYMFYQGPLSSWYDARSNCQSIQGDLINVKSVDLQTWLNAQMLNSDNARAYWTGLTDIANEGNYIWTDGTPMDTNVVFWNQEPNDYKGQEDCGLLKANGYFNDVSCQDTKAAAVCEIDNTPTCPTKGGTWVSRKADFGPLFNCYLFSQYQDVTKLMLQSEAKDFCKRTAINATLTPFLLSIDSLNEKAFIKSQLQQYSDNPYGYHTSLNDKQAEGFWTFANSKDLSSSSDLIDWSGEPNNQTADTDCVNTQYGGYYEVKKCSEKQGFICQRPVGLAWQTTGGAKKSGSVIYIIGITILLHMLKS